VLFRGTAADAVAAYRRGADEAYESTSMLFAPAAGVLAAVAGAGLPAAEAELSFSEDATGSAAAIAAEFEAHSSDWVSVAPFAVQDAVEVPSPMPGGDAPAAGASAEARPPATVAPDAIAPATAAALTLFARAASALGGFASLRGALADDAAE